MIQSNFLYSLLHCCIIFIDFIWILPNSSVCCCLSNENRNCSLPSSSQLAPAECSNRRAHDCRLKCAVNASHVGVRLSPQADRILQKKISRASWLRFRVHKWVMLSSLSMIDHISITDLIVCCHPFRNRNSFVRTVPCGPITSMLSIYSALIAEILVDTQLHDKH